MERLIKFESWAVLWGSLMGSVLSFISPVSPFIALAICLILGDWRLGVLAAKKRNEIINAEGFKKTSIKLTVYLILILSAEGVKRVFFDGFEDGFFPFVAQFPITYIAAFVICMNEFKSISDKAYQLTGVQFWNVISDRIETVFSLFKKNKSDDSK